MVRLFIGVPVPGDVASAAAELQGSLSRMPMRIKLVEPENMHLTLAFLGEVAKEKIPGVSEVLDKVCGSHRCFTAKIGGIKLLPKEGNFRVVAFNVASLGGALESLRKDVFTAVGGESHPAHLTVARVREVSDRGFVRENIGGMSLDRYFEIYSVCLMKSIMSSRGPVYETLHESKLR
jgi:2'-5' RNA ligase